MNLIVDVGNTRAKLAVFQGDDLKERYTVQNQAVEEKILEIHSLFPNLKNAILSSVSNVPFTWPPALVKDLQILVLGPALQLPFHNLYATPETLGNDRKALVAAAAKYYCENNVLIIDAGTCLTYDFKNHRNEYLGGGISPGLKMRFQALHTFTARLPLAEVSEKPVLIGNTTLNSINSGVVFGITREIEGIIEDYQTNFEDLRIILTGGDAHFLSMRLKNSIFANSNFLLEGLNQILEFNISQ